MLGNSLTCGDNSEEGCEHTLLREVNDLVSRYLCIVAVIGSVIFSLLPPKALTSQDANRQQDIKEKQVGGM